MVDLLALYVERVSLQIEKLKVEDKSILTAFDGEETFRRVEWKYSEVSFASDDHVAPEGEGGSD